MSSVGGVAAPPSPPSPLVPNALDHTIVSTQQSWQAAQATCAGMGKQLAVAYTAYDYANLASWLEASSSLLFGSALVWIGARDIAVEGVWQWVDGAPVTYFEWGTGQPGDPGNEDCLALFKEATGWRWIDSACASSFKAVCSPLSPPLPPLAPSPPLPPPTPPLSPPNLLVGGGFVLSASLPLDPGPLSWSAAQTHCQAVGLQLAILRSASDQAGVEALIPPGSASHYWIGLSRASASSAFVWVDGSPLTASGYSNWYGSGPSVSTTRHCGEVYPAPGGKFQWNVGSCGGMRSFVCGGLSPPSAPPLPPLAPPWPPLGPSF